MSLKLIRVTRLKEFAAARKLVGPGAIGLAIGKATNQTSDLLSGNAPFGEKVARSIETYAGLQPGWLDNGVDAPPVPPIAEPVAIKSDPFSVLYAIYDAVPSDYKDDAILAATQAMAVFMNRRTAAATIGPDRPD